MKFLENLQNKLFELPLFGKGIQWTKKNSFPGFFDVPLYDVAKFIFHELKKEAIITRANSIAFSLFLSLFPTILVFFTLIPIILPYFSDYILPFIDANLIQYDELGQVKFQQTIIEQLSVLLQQMEVIPKTIHSQLIDFVSSVFLEPRFGLLSVGFLLAVFFASNGMISLMNGMEKSHATTFMKRNVIIKRLIAFRLTFLIGFLVFSALILIVLGNTFLYWFFSSINASGFTVFAINILRFLVVFLLFYFGIAVIYRFGPPTLKRFSYFSPGTMLAAVLSLLSSWIFSIFINNYGRYNELYGSIGTIIILMLWIQINAFILLVGFELNAAIAVNRDLKKAIAKEEKIMQKEERKKTSEEEE